MVQGECNVMREVSAKSQFWGKLVLVNCLPRKINTCKLNINGQQEREHKAHPKQSYSKCLTTQCKDS